MGPAEDGVRMAGLGGGCPYPFPSRITRSSTRLSSSAA